jgi:predicted nucleic acid-binding protein
LGLNAALIDTNVISYALKRDSRYEWYREQLHACLPCISFMTLAELHYWAEYRNWGTNAKRRMQGYLKRFVFLEVDEEMCRVWSQIVARCRRAGDPIDTADGWIAATALRFDLPLITHNAADFEPIQDLTVISAPKN